MQLLPTIIIVSILGFFITLTLGCITWHWRKSRPQYVRSNTIGSHLKTPVRRLTIQGGRVIDVEDTLEKGSVDDDGYGSGTYPTLKAFVDPEEAPREPSQAHLRDDARDPRSSWSTNGAHEKFPMPGQPLESPRRASGIIRDAHSITIPAGLFSDHTGSFTLPRPSLINIEKKTSRQSSRAGKDRRDTYPNERKTRSRSRSRQGKSRLRNESKRSSGQTEKSVETVDSASSKQRGKQRASAPESTRTRKSPSASSSRRTSQVIPNPPPLPTDITSSQQQAPSKAKKDAKSRPSSNRSGPPEPTPRTSSLAGSIHRPPTLDLASKTSKTSTPVPQSPISQGRFTLASSNRTSSTSAKRPPPLDLKPKSSIGSLQRPSPLGPGSFPSPAPTRGLSPLSPEFKAVLSPVQPPPPLSVNAKPASPTAKRPPPIVTDAKGSSRPSPLDLRPDANSHVRFASTIEAHRRSILSPTESPAALTPSTVDGAYGIVRAPPPSMIEEPLYKSPPPPTSRQVEAELNPHMVARMDRPPSLDVDIPRTGSFSFFDSSSMHSSAPPQSAELRRGPSVMSNRSAITIASSEVSSNWTIGNAQVVNIYPSVNVGPSSDIAAARGGAPAPPPSTSPGISEEQRSTPPYAKTLRSKFGRYPRGRRDKALPGLPKSPLSMSFGVDEVEMRQEQGSIPQMPGDAKTKGKGR